MNIRIEMKDLEKKDRYLWKNSAFCEMPVYESV